MTSAQTEATSEATGHAAGQATGGDATGDAAGQASGEAAHSRTWTIAQIADEFGVTHRTVRHYEDLGLISPERRGTQRIYHRRDRTRLKLILRGKRLGFSLAEVREMLELYDSAPDERPQLQKFLGALSARREQLEGQRRDIDAVLGEIRAFEAQSRKLLNGRRRRKR
jgi:DNA-binding transcriptional MerR regulator